MHNINGCDNSHSHCLYKSSPKDHEVTFDLGLTFTHCLQKEDKGAGKVRLKLKVGSTKFYMAPGPVSQVHMR